MGKWELPSKQEYLKLLYISEIAQTSSVAHTNSSNWPRTSCKGENK